MPRESILLGLREFWIQAHSLCQVELVPESEVIFNDILVRMEEPHRRYHTLGHVLDACQTFNQLALQDARIADRGEGLFALFIHDIVYEIGATDNESRSAAYGRERLPAFRLTERSVSLITEIVDLTSSHHYDGDNETVKSCLDADMAILGSTPDRYCEYITLLREEYRQVDDDAWRQGRRQFLNATLASPIFLTQSAKQAFEIQARKNIKAELDALSN